MSPAPIPPASSDREERYSRQVLFEPLGAEGQARLGAGRVVIVGCGALGSVQADLLVRAGVGRLTLVDRDYLDWSNLQRQSLYTEEDVRQRLPKAVAAARHLRNVNSDVQVTGHVEDLNGSNVLQRLEGHHLILDGTDNFETRFLLNEASLRLRIPWIYGACVGSYGMTATFLPGEPPCFHCLLEDMQPGMAAPTCDTVGVIAPAVLWAASIQVTEALKLLTGSRESLHGCLLSWDAWRCSYQQISLASAAGPGCPVCTGKEAPFLEGSQGSGAAVLCGRNAVMLRPAQAGACSLPDLEKRLSRVAQVTANAYLVKADIEGYELVVFADGRGVVRGTSDAALARSLYARYVGA